MESRVDAPVQAGSRDQARALLAALPADLEGMPVVLDCKALVISTPSFLDEVVRVVLVERGAVALDLVDANERTRTHVMRAATNRGVAEKVRVGLRMPG